MVVANHIYFYVLKGQISKCKDGRMRTISVNTYFLLNKIKLKFKKMNLNEKTRSPQLKFYRVRIPDSGLNFSFN